MFDSRTDPLMDRFVADFVEGAARNTRANGGPGVNILVGGSFFNHGMKQAGAPGALEQRYAAGAEAAARALGIKVAFLPMLGSLLGGAALKKGIGALAGGAGGSMLGGLAGKIAPHMAGGVGGAAVDMAGSMAGNALGQKLQRPQQPPPQGMMG